MQIVKLGEICETYGGGTPPREVAEYFGGDIFWITPTEIPKDGIGQINSSRETLTREGLEKSSAKLLPKGAVLMTSRASIGNVGIANVPVATNQGFVSFVCGPTVQNTYLAYYLLKNKSRFENAANGATFKEIPRSTVRKFESLCPTSIRNAMLPPCSTGPMPSARKTANYLPTTSNCRKPYSWRCSANL